LGVAEAATRYLAVEHALAAPAAYRAVLDQVRAVARRRGDSRWRLLGVELQAQQVGTASVTPSLDEWAEAEGLGDWSADELQLMYAERFGSVDASGKRRQASWRRLPRCPLRCPTWSKAGCLVRSPRCCDAVVC
jgi:hypothetical protein